MLLMLDRLRLGEEGCLVDVLGYEQLVSWCGGGLQ